jgi:hypothetical protein
VVIIVDHDYHEEDGKSTCHHLLSPVRPETPSHSYNLHSAPDRIAALGHQVESQGDGLGRAGGDVGRSGVIGGGVARSGVSAGEVAVAGQQRDRGG